MAKISIHGHESDQPTNTPFTDNDTSSVLPSELETSPKECEPPSSENHHAGLQAAIETALIMVSLILVALLLPRAKGPDGISRYKDLVSLLSTHSLFQPHSRFSLIGPSFSTPLLLIGEPLGHPVEWVCFYNLLLFSLCLLLSYILLRNYVDRGLLRKFFLVLICGSMFIANLGTYYGETFTALCVGFGVFVTFRRFTSVGGWIAVILGAANTPATLVGLTLLVLKNTFDSKRLRYILVPVLTAGCILLEYQIRRGSIFNTGYIGDHGPKTVMPYSGLPDFSYPFFFGLLSILFSFGRGLLFFVPGLLLPIRKTLSKWQHQKINLYQVYTLWICFVIGLILTYSRWWAWDGGMHFWAPRFFLFASIPASFALAVRLIRYKEASLGVNMLTLVIFCLSAWVSVNGAAFQVPSIGHVLPRVCSQKHFLLYPLCVYTPEYSPLWQPFVSHPHISQGQMIFLIYSLLVAAYLVAPLLIHLLKQTWDLAKQYDNMNLKQWQF
ncbi:MAG TPA: hypothetical protein VGL94_05535 [Ktedonobacteraceae bacterium]